MRVEVRLFATLARFLPPEAASGSAAVDVPEGSTIKALVARLGIPADMPAIALVNGDEAVLGHPLAADDVVDLFPPLMGGSD